MYCIKVRVTTYYIRLWFICGRMEQTGKTVIDQPEGTKRERPGMT